MRQVVLIICKAFQVLPEIVRETLEIKKDEGAMIIGVGAVTWDMSAFVSVTSFISIDCWDDLLRSYRN